MLGFHCPLSFSYQAHPPLMKNKWKMRGEAVARAQCRLDSITPFQSALTTPFFPFILHSLPLNYPSRSHLPLPPLVPRRGCSFRAGTMGETEYAGNSGVKEGPSSTCGERRAKAEGYDEAELIATAPVRKNKTLLTVTCCEWRAL